MFVGAIYIVDFQIFFIRSRPREELKIIFLLRSAMNFHQLYIVSFDAKQIG